MNTESARNVKEFVTIASRDAEGRPIVLRIPGHGGKSYEVTLTRNGGVSATCMQLNGIRQVACQGNSHSVCYHVLAACEVAANDAGLELSWCNSQADAERLARIEGKTFCVESAQSGKRAWGVVRGEQVEQVEIDITLANARRYVELLPAYYANPRMAIEDRGFKDLRLFFAARNGSESTVRRYVMEHDPDAILAYGRALLRGENEVEL